MQKIKEEYLFTGYGSECLRGLVVSYVEQGSKPDQL